MERKKSSRAFLVSRFVLFTFCLFLGFIYFFLFYVTGSSVFMTIVFGGYAGGELLDTEVHSSQIIYFLSIHTYKCNVCWKWATWNIRTSLSYVFNWNDFVCFSGTIPKQLLYLRTEVIVGIPFMKLFRFLTPSSLTSRFLN